MKILIGNDNFSAHFFERLGYLRVFQACGHQAVLWNIQDKPANDIFDEFEPDIFMFQSYNLNRAIINCIQRRPHLYTIMKCGEWGHCSDTIDRNKYQVLCATQQEIDNVMALHTTCNQPNYLSTYYHPDWIEDSFGHWMKYGMNVKSHLLAADLFEYTNGTPKPELRCDLSFVGGYWPYKARVLEEYLIPLCRDNSCKIKIFGNGIWPVHQYCGSIPDNLVKHLWASSTICPNLHEPHSQDLHRDCNERTFKLLANRSFVISDYIEGLARIFKDDEIVFAHNPQEFKELILHYIKYPNERIPYIQRGYKKVIMEHSYFERVQEVFMNLNLLNEAANISHMKSKILKPKDVI